MQKTKNTEGFRSQNASKLFKFNKLSQLQEVTWIIFISVELSKNKQSGSSHSRAYVRTIYKDKAENSLKRSSMNKSKSIFF